MLEVRWAIYAAAKKWEAALDIAATFIQLAPGHPFGWLHRLFALHELNRTAEARDNLLRVVDTFSDNATMRYNLACYESQLGRMEEAKSWLVEAFKLGDKRRMKQMALTDSDLEPLREWILLVPTLSCLDDQPSWKMDTTIEVKNITSDLQPPAYAARRRRPGEAEPYVAAMQTSSRSTVDSALILSSSSLSFLSFSSCSAQWSRPRSFR